MKKFLFRDNEIEMIQLIQETEKENLIMELLFFVVEEELKGKFLNQNNNNNHLNK